MHISEKAEMLAIHDRLYGLYNLDVSMYKVYWIEPLYKRGEILYM